MTQENIQSTLQEIRTFPASQDFINTAALSADKLAALYAQAKQGNQAFWADQARQEIDWQTPFTETLDDSNAPFYRWFHDGKLNASYNCLDRQLKDNAD